MLSSGWTQPLTHPCPADAQIVLGCCFEHGEAQDWAEAVRYYRLAAAAQANALSAAQLAIVTASCQRIACSREVAATCCLGCGARRKLKTCAKCHVARFCSTERVCRARLAGAQAELQAMAGCRATTQVNER
jgi:hypothetical protein